VNASATEIGERTRLIGSADEILPATTSTAEDGVLSFEQIVERYEPRVRRLAYRLLGWRDDVDDVTQDVFFAAFRSKPLFRGDGHLWTWLMRITINQCRTQQRKRLVRFKALRRIWRPEEKIERIESERDETKQRVQKAVAALGTKDREVIVLYYLEEMDVKSMSELLGISVGAVNVRLHRARDRLREPLGDLMKDES
jgi:RNA polymerase sigma-70 factor (ECF subfamily)